MKIPVKKTLFPALSILFLFFIPGCGGGGGGAAQLLLALSVSSGDFHTCAVKSDGTVWCWGDNTSGELGNGVPGVDFFTAQEVAVISNALEVSAGGAHTCARLNDGRITCWGAGGSGQLGNGLTADIAVPISRDTGITTAIDVSAGEAHTCAVKTDNTVWCWGNNASGQLGDGTQNNTRLSPVQVSGINNAIAVSAGGNHTCALLTGGTVWCWGDNSFGQLGNSSTPQITPLPNSSTPVLTSIITYVLALSAGANHTCAVNNVGTVYCWGDDSSGQVGSPWNVIGTSFSTSPLTVNLGNSAIGVTAGLGHSCAVISDGTIKCWGDGGAGQLGSGGFPILTPSFSVPILPVINMSTATQVDAGGSHTCARLSDNRVQCWGDNTSGQLGDGSGFTSNKPVSVVQ